MKKTKLLALLLTPVLALSACSAPGGENATTSETLTPSPSIPVEELYPDAAAITLSDEGILVDGAPVTEDPTAPVYTAHDIVYYEEGHDFTYGEGTASDAHSAGEAAAHTVVHITEAGSYLISGKLSQGQIAVDLGDDAEDDPTAVVTLIFNGADITCTVAPAVIFYNVYECGSTDTETATKDVDTTAAGANVIIADGSENTVAGSYVARIYKPDSVELNEEKTEVLDAKKLHKYDAAFYSKMSMNVLGGPDGTGHLFIDAENEGLDSELHLTILGGNIEIESGNDGINTNEDYVSVTTVKDGSLFITVTGETGEGDGIDSNGWLVIEGGTVVAEACAVSGDAGIDSDMGIHILGGTVVASGNMLDRIETGGQNYAVFNFSQKISGGQTAELKNADGTTILTAGPENDYSILILSDPDLTAGDYTLWVDGTQYQGSAGSMQGGMMRPGGQKPENFDPEDLPAGFDPENLPAGMERPNDMKRPEDFDPENLPEGFDPSTMAPPEGTENPGEMFRPGGLGGGRGQGGNQPGGEASPTFTITAGGSVFRNVAPVA